MRLLSIGNRYPPWSLGGYERMWSGATAAQRAAGHTVRILTTLPDPTDLAPSSPPDPQVHRELAWYWRAHAFPERSARRTLALERHNRRVLARHLAEFSPDLVLWWSMGGMSLSLIAQVERAGVPAAGVVGDDWFAYGPRVDRWSAAFAGRWAPLAPLAARLTGIPTRARPDRAARWAFISRTVLEAAAGEAGWNTSSATVIHPGVDRARFPPTPPSPFAWRLLVPGRIEPRKGPEVAVRALPHLPSQATLTLDGSGEADYLRRLHSLAAELGVADRVRFTRSAGDELAGAYASADVVLFPVCWREPWGLVPLEAMSVGRPVVASDAGGGPGEYLRAEQNCLLHPPGDAAALADRVRRLAAEGELRERLVRGGHETAARLTEETFNRGVLSLIACCSSRRRPR